ncbi:MAG: anti-virulence regulator CigR family protein [Woeseia sp.]
MRIAVVSLAGLLILGPGAAVSAETGVGAAQHGSLEVEVVFTDEEIRLIYAHYQSHREHDGKGNGGHKQKELPPGIAKNLARGKPLPPGIAKQALPYELRLALPPVRGGHERIIVAGKILLVEIATQVVRDVLTDVILD